MSTATTKITTEENIKNACAQLRRDGHSVSVLTVTARLGGGSPNDISPVVTAWKAKHPLEKPEEIPLDPSVAKMLAKQIALCAAVAAQSAEALLAEAVEDVRTLSARGQVLEQRVTALETELENALQEIQRLKGELSERTQLYDAAREESLAAIEASEAAAASERATAESLRDKLVRSEIRIEGLLGAEQSLTVAEQELKRVTENFSQLKEAAAIAQERTGAAVQRAEQAEAREAAARADSAQLHERLQAAHASAHELAKTLASVSANLAESLERQEPLKEAAEAIIAGLNRYGAQRPVGPSDATAAD
jgi:colicin import membrane protein